MEGGEYKLRQDLKLILFEIGLISFFSVCFSYAGRKALIFQTQFWHFLLFQLTFSPTKIMCEIWNSIWKHYIWMWLYLMGRHDYDKGKLFCLKPSDVTEHHFQNLAHLQLFAGNVPAPKHHSIWQLLFFISVRKAECFWKYPDASEIKSL